VEITQAEFDALTNAAKAADVNLTPAFDGTGMGVFWGALAKAQGKFDVIETNKDVTIRMKAGGSYRFKYANLAEIRAKTVPALSANALALVTIVTETDHVTTIRTILGHDSGAQIESVLRLKRAEGSDIKDFGSAITYLRRYVVGSMLGVAADDDVDSDPEQREGETEGHRDGPISTPTHPELKKATTPGELAKAMNAIPAADRSQYTAYFTTRMAEIKAATPAEPALPATPDDL